MKKYKLNQAAETIELIATVNMEELERLGWEFNHEDTADALDISYEEAKERNREVYTVHIRIEKDNDSGNIETFFFLESDADVTVSMETGDDTKTIEDVFSLLEKGKLTIHDYSEDEYWNPIQGYIVDCEKSTAPAQIWNDFSIIVDVQVDGERRIEVRKISNPVEVSYHDWPELAENDHEAIEMFIEHLEDSEI